MEEGDGLEKSKSTKQNKIKPNRTEQDRTKESDIKYQKRRLNEIGKKKKKTIEEKQRNK